MIGNIPYTPRVKKVLALAAKEAKALNHTYVGTEHILLGLLREGDGVAARVLKNLDVDIEQTRQEILKELDPNFAAQEESGAAPTASAGEDAEKQMTSSAIRTDFILSAEIMVIALNEVADQSFWPRLIILVVVALVITAAVYGVVAVIVKMDDVGLSLAQRSSRFAQKFGRGLVAAMPKVLSTLSTVGTVAMLWVGGHILLVGTDDLGWHLPYGLVHHVEEDVHHAVQAVGGLLAWLVNTAASAVIGLVVGAIVVAVVHVLPFGKKDSHDAPEPAEEPAKGDETP